jgi:CheY-like chemotaxis protein
MLIRRLKILNPQEPKIRILYVDDSAVIRETIARLLELKGDFALEYARNGKEGIEKVSSWKPDIILMDLRMPVMDGLNAINEIKTNPKTRHLPVFVITAWSGTTERAKAQAAGADRYFVKPPDIDDLTEAIRETVGALKK